MRKCSDRTEIERSTNRPTNRPARLRLERREVKCLFFAIWFNRRQIQTVGAKESYKKNYEDDSWRCGEIVSNIKIIPKIISSVQAILPLGLWTLFTHIILLGVWGGVIPKRTTLISHRTPEILTGSSSYFCTTAVYFWDEIQKIRRHGDAKPCLQGVSGAMNNV